MDLEYVPERVHLAECAPCQCVAMADQFLAMQEITYEEAKKDRVAAWFRLADTSEEKELQRVVTCHYAQWREKAWECLEPLIDDFVRQNIQQLCQYYNDLAEAYHIHLAELLAQEEEKKDEVSAQLSDDERMLQEDNDWLTCFKEQLTHIERD